MSYTRALAALHETTYGGVYYTADIDFADSGHNPTWTRLATTGLANLLVKAMQNDHFTPYDDIYVQLDNNDVYRWNGASWTKIMSTTIAATYAAGCDTFGKICVDPTTPGVIYYPVMKGVTYVKLIKSTDYGATWTVINVVNGVVSGVPFVQANGETLAVNFTGAAGYRLYFSYNGGAAWTQASPNPGNNFGLQQNPHNPSQVYMMAGSVNYNLNLHTVASATTLQSGLDLGWYFPNRTSAHWIDPDTAGHERIIKSNGANLNMYYTTDQWATVNTPADWASISGKCNVIAADLGNSDNILIGGSNDTGAAGEARVGAKVGDNDNAPWIASGANYSAAPYTDSIPSAANTYVSYMGLWVGEGPSPKGVYVYSDELGDITNIPDYDGLGAPMFGDRGSWRDRQQDGFDIYHAEDVHRNEREIHAPQPSGNDGYGIIESGGFWVNSSEAMVTTGDLHDPVTLDTDAAVLLDITGQEIGLDTQSANTVFAGPSSGAANEPTFRALVAADLGTGAPDGTKYLRDDLTWQAVGGSHEHIINEDHSAECDGSEDTFSTWLDFRILSTQVYLNGLRQYLGTDYTEAAALDSVVFVTPPEAGDILTIDYICTDADYQTLSGLLLDSDGIPLLDSDGEVLTDS